MAKRNIEVKEKNLVGRLNDRVRNIENCMAQAQLKEAKKKYEPPVVRWDNHGPVQFEDYKVDVDTAQGPDTGVTTVWKHKSPNTAEAVEILRNQVDKKTDNGVGSIVKTLADYKNKDTQLRAPDEKKEYEEVNHPDHYNQYDVEVIDMMERVFGTLETAIFCKLNAYKYRQRMGNKPGQDLFKDLAKEKWYLAKTKELKDKLGIKDKLVLDKLVLKD